MMDEPHSQEVEEALRRAEAQKRPANLGDSDVASEETLADEAGYRRPTRPEHTAEKEHPEGKN